MSAATGIAGSAGRQYALVNAAYWSFTLTDGALRMLVLLHFFALGYTPFQLALMFWLYEAAGIVANLFGGWAATHYGVTRTLAAGIGLQVVGLLMLSALDPAWSPGLSVVWVVVSQGVSGVAKDLTKTSAKSAIRLVATDQSTTLFRWVAWFTGSKNAMKGVGFFVGGLLLASFGFRGTLWILAAALVLVLAGVLVSLPRLHGGGKASKVRELFAKSPGVNRIAAARVFLFGARDVWFVVGVPVFLYANGWHFIQVAGFLAAWTIGYGLVQAIAPKLVARSADGLSREIPAAKIWAAVLAAVPFLIMGALQLHFGLSPDVVLIGGLALFGVAFAVNSSLHSYLILAYAGSKKAAEDVGFYYAANAAGRLAGTLLSGLLYQAGGLFACLAGSGIMLLACLGVCLVLPGRAPQLSGAR